MSAFPLSKNSNLQEKRHFQQSRKVSMIMKKPQPLHLKNSQFLQKPLTPSKKIFNSLEVTSRTPSMRKSQFSPPETIENPPEKISTPPLKSLNPTREKS